MNSGKNLLFLMADEHARSALGAYGNQQVQTPALDTLAGRGTRFTRAYTASPICIPARASLATGLPVFEHGCYSSAQPYAGQMESWMHRLRDRGRAVVSIGKLHFRSAADDNGFSEEILPMHVANQGKGWPQALLRRPMPEFQQASELAGQVGAGETSYSDYDRRIAAVACHWLERYGSRIRSAPWTLFVSFVCPHYPLTAPEAFFDLYRDSVLPAPFGIAPGERPRHPVLNQMAEFWNYDDYFDAAGRNTARRAYLGLCSFVDDNVRRVLRALETSGQAQDTVVIYTSDHGEMLGNHGFWTKSVMYEDSVAIPMLMAGADVPVGLNRTPVCLSDLASTAETIAGLTPMSAAADWRSRPLHTFLCQAEPDRFVLSEYHDGGSPTGLFMIRQGRWKYIYYAGGYACQLFDLEDDPRELRDLGGHTDYRSQRDWLHGLLCECLNPEQVNNAALASQADMVEALGGAEKVMALSGFNHTPVHSDADQDCT